MHGVGGDANKAGDSDRLEGDKDPLSAFNWGPLPIHQQLSANFIFGDNNYLQQQQQQQHHLNSYIHYHSYPSAETTTTPFGGGNYPFPPDNLSPIDHHYHYNNNIGNSTTTTTTTANILDFKKPPLSIATSSSSSSSYSSSNSTLKDKDALSAAIMMSSTVTDEADRGDDIDGGGSFYANTGAGAEVEFRKNLGIRPRRSVVGSSGGGVGDNHHLQATPTSTSTSTPTPTYPFISFSSSSSSTPLPQQPSSSSAKPTKEMLTKDINCQQCNVPVGTLIFHGFAEALDTPHSVRVWCTSCQVFAHGAATTPASSRGGAAIHSSSLPSTPKTSEYPIMCNPLDLVSDTLSTTIPTNATDTSRPLKKKRNSKTDKFSDSNSSLLECDSCKRQVGTCVARLLPSIITSAAASSIKATDPFLDLRTRPESLEPDFGIEIICCICRDKYGFCTECGGKNM